VTRFMTVALMTATLGTGYLVGTTHARDRNLRAHEAGPPAQPARVFELRTYTAAPGKLDDLLTRFRDHTLRIFEKHGMTNVGYWMPQDEPLSENTLVYLLAHASRQSADDSWRAFSSDPEWQQVAEESRRDGRLVVNVERVYLDPTDFSPIR
jgi:hypothetical protein